ncbi:MAG: NAD(P)/FAD-dependent oxidoreductase [Candidatus Omnitrophica bacterium]|nr:NAD(P)/FAD-dependent oxidoreductase [Candidatus Omnitrophota bacterium]
MKVAIIGGSAAGHAVATNLRKKSKDISITLISDEAFPFYDRRRLLDFWRGTAREKELFGAGSDTYAAAGITFLKESKAVSVNPTRRTVSIKQDEKRSSIDYDVLVVATGTKTPLPDIPGIAKTGVFCFDGLADFKELKSTVTADAVCLIGTNRYTDGVIAVLSEKNVEVKLVVAEPPAPERQFPQNVEVLVTEIVDIIGESGVQAIKLTEGKIIGVSWVGVMHEPVPQTDFLKDTGADMRDGALVVDESMRTSLQDVYACGSVCTKAEDAPGQKTRDDITAESETIVKAIVTA